MSVLSPTWRLIVALALAADLILGVSSLRGVLPAGATSLNQMEEE